mgnify:CR=1 FL=1
MRKFKESHGFSRGRMSITENLFEELCEEYNIKVHWKNSINEKLDIHITYQTKGRFLFACGENGELYHVKPEGMQKSNNCDIGKEDLLINGYESNLGLASTDFCQGKFLVMEDVFEELCAEYDIKVDFAGR